MNVRNEFLIPLYTSVLKIRLVEEAIADRYTEWQMRCPVHLSIGQEASAAGICAHLRDTDTIASTHRSHAHYLAKGGSLPAMIAELYGKIGGCVDGRGGSMHLFDQEAGVMPCLPIVGSSIPMGVGAALSSKLNGQDTISVVFLGDGAVEEGIFHESANFASIRRLPVIFAVENNFYSVCTPLGQRQPDRPLEELASVHAIASVRIDGNDAVAVYDAMAEAVRRARTGSGPSLLVMETYRLREHCGPLYDLDLGYRDQAEYDSWEARCPVGLLREKLSEALGWTDQDDAKLRREIGQKINDAFEFAAAAPFPDADKASEHVYV